MDNFNPYHEWLGLDRELREPTHYELLRVDPDETSPEIAAAAVAAMCRVRKCRPGSRPAEWAQLFDELVAAKKLLCDSSQRAEYDRQLEAQRPCPALPDPQTAPGPPSMAAVAPHVLAAHRRSAIRAAERGHSPPPARHPQRDAEDETPACDSPAR